MRRWFRFGPLGRVPAVSQGELIRSRIEANRIKRLTIAEAMKREAGVTGHEINREDLSGLARLGQGRIVSPEGRNMLQLHTLAHECGHIFLHSHGEGRLLATHVMEMEAESYAHQAFHVHGMCLPKAATDWGRTYVGQWVEHDRAAGIPIDPRVVAYVSGERSPLEPLRAVPATWLKAGVRAAPRRSELPRHDIEVPLRQLQGACVQSAPRGELNRLLNVLATQFGHGFLAGMIGSALAHWYDIGPPWLRIRVMDGTSADLASALQLIAVALVWTSIAMLVRTMILPRPRRAGG